MKDTVSIIIPCHNAENYIMRCLKSVENQTFGMDHLEVILVNDGSEDNTLAYLKVFEDKHIDNVYVIDFTKNRGPSAARNAGLKIATGKYVCFIDSDDTIDATAIEKMYLKAEENDCDLVECGYLPVVNEEQCIPKKNGEDWYRNLTIVQDRRWYIVHMPKLTMWARLWKRDFFLKNHLWLDEDCLMSEDTLFTGQAMFLLQNCYYINETLYFYFINQESMSHSSQYKAEQNRGVIDACYKLVECLKERGLWDEVRSNYWQEFGWYFFGPSYFYTMGNIYSEINYIKQAVRNVFPDICENRYLQILDETHAEYMRHLK